jgi:hypothetical protein
MFFYTIQKLHDMNGIVGAAFPAGMRMREALCKNAAPLLITKRGMHRQ